MESFIKRNNEYEILTPSGWSDFSGIKRTTKNVKVVLKFYCLILICTEDHKLKTENDIFVFAKDLQKGDEVLSKTGKITLLEKTILEEKDYFYDPIEVVKNNEYYSNDLISHNCQFLGSSGTLISGNALKALVPKNPISKSDGLTQFFLPEKGKSYTMVVDVSRGKGLDYSAFSVIDVTSMPYNQVCVYRNNMVTPVDYASVVHRISKLYNDATILVEVNDIGAQVSDTLYMDFESEALIYTESNGRNGKKISSGFGKNVDRGVRTTKSVKSIGCSILKLLIEQQQLIVNDPDTIYELSRFSKKGVSYEAESGATDDLVMGLVLFGWMSDQKYFKELTNIETLAILRDRTEAEIEASLLPFGYGTSLFEDEESNVIDLTKNPHHPDWNLNF